MNSEFAQRGLMAHLGIEIVEANAEQVILKMPITSALHQPYGYLHGGASVVLAESVASIGGSLRAGKGNACFGMEINANHLRPKRDGVLTAIGTPVHVGKTSQVWEIKISDEQEKLVCISRCTLAVVEV